MIDADELVQKIKEQRQKKHNDYLEQRRAKYREYYRENSERIIESKQRTYQKKRLQLIKDLGGKCQLCGIWDISMGEFNIHHTVPMEVTKESKLYHYIRNMDIMCLLCEDCHVVWHRIMDWLGLDDIYKDD